MSVVGLEQTLRDLPRVGTLVKDRGYRQVWRFEFNGRGYYLKFYRRRGFRDRFRRFFRGSPARAEFIRLQWLQKAQIPAPRAVALMVGFRLQGQIGDAVILEAIEPAIQLDTYCLDFDRRGEPIPDHLQLAELIRNLLQQLAQAGLGHEDLHLGNFLLKEGKLFLLDGYAVQRGGLKLRHLMYLAHSVRRYATKTDLLRGWCQLGPGWRMPFRNPVTGKMARTFIRRRLDNENRYFGTISVDGWQGFFFKHDKYPRRWSAASRLEITHEDWDKALPDLLAKMERDELTVLKRSRSGDVLAASVTLGGQELPIILKRPRRRYWYRYVNEIGRGSRPRRAWYKAWRMVLRGFPTAWPLLMIERRTLGYATDGLVIFERVPGPTLARADLDAMSESQRDMLFRRTGRILRALEREGFAHFDAKASNWIVRDDPQRGPSPVMIDVDGIRRRRWIALGIHRLLKSMHDNPQYSPADSFSLCKGYAPTAQLYVEQGPRQKAPLESQAPAPEDQGATGKGGMEADQRPVSIHDDRQQPG